MMYSMGVGNEPNPVRSQTMATTFSLRDGSTWTFGNGSFIKPDGHRVGECLQQGDDPVDSGYRGSDYRYPGTVNVAVNVKVTGRTVQWRDGASFVRCQIEWVGDCEPSTFSGGWVKVDRTWAEEAA
jgi:hypothetical protein